MDIHQIEAIQFRMEQQGLMPKDLAAMIGRSNRVVEVLLRRRPLTLASDGIKITGHCSHTKQK